MTNVYSLPEDHPDRLMELDHLQAKQEAEYNATRPTTYIDGYGTVYEDTGELVEADPDAPTQVLNAFQNPEGVEFTETDVEWALRKLFRLDGNIVAANARLKAEVDAIQKNWTPEINRVKRARDSFVRWVSPMVRRYAERQLMIRNTKKDGTLKADPEKSVKFVQGVLAFKTKPATPEKVAIQADKSVAEATAWVEEHFPDYIVRTPSIDFARFTEEDRKKLREMEGCPLAIVEATPPTEEFSIKTGVK